MLTWYGADIPLVQRNGRPRQTPSGEEERRLYQRRHEGWGQGDSRRRLRSKAAELSGASLELLVLSSIQVQVLEQGRARKGQVGKPGVCLLNVKIDWTMY